MKKVKIFFAALGLVSSISNSNAQVQYKIERIGDNNNFMVYAIADETYDTPKNIVSTAQVTLVAPSGSFQIDKVVNLYSNANWRVNGKSAAPKENQNADYIYFGLENLGTNAFRFTKGKETPLFLIQTKTCEGTIALMDNDKDPFKFPNSQQINVGNTMTILGAGGDAYKGLVKNFSIADCKKTAAATLDDYKIRVSPNITQPTTVQIEFMRRDNELEKGTISIYDGAARVVWSQDINAQKGYNIVSADLSHLTNGIYYIMLSGVKLNPVSERLVITE